MRILIEGDRNLSETYYDRKARLQQERGEKKPMTKMQPNECRCTKKGIEYCMIPNVGVRFKGKGECGPKPEKPTEETAQEVETSEKSQTEKT